MPQIRKTIVIQSPQGLHARPAALFVQIASRFNSLVTVECGGEKINGRSIMGLLTLGLQKGTNIILDVNGDDAEQVFTELEQLISKEDL